MRVKSATTANFGRPNDAKPGAKPIMVHKIDLDICSSLSTARCRPVPWETALMVMATVAQLQTWRKQC
jgi:hypothetical protein